MKYDAVITRHDGLTAYLKEEGYIDEETEVIEHADIDDVRGYDTIGVLPMRLAAATRSHTEVSIEFPPDYRGEELDKSEVAEYATEIVRYLIDTVESEEV